MSKPREQSAKVKLLPGESGMTADSYALNSVTTPHAAENQFAEGNTGPNQALLTRNRAILAHRPITRSITKLDSGALLFPPPAGENASRLEDARSVVNTNNAVEEGAKELPGVLTQRAPKRVAPWSKALWAKSKRAKLTSASNATLELAEAKGASSLGDSNTLKQKTLQKRGGLDFVRVPKRLKKLLRRSPRLATLPTKFPFYDKLPNEIRLQIWEAHLQPRLVYLRNNPLMQIWDGQRNEHPAPWRSTDRCAQRIFQGNYHKRFVRHHLPDDSMVQPFNSKRDIVVWEPCSKGCRGNGCARHQFLPEDLKAVQKLAMQNEPAFIARHGHPHIWRTVTFAWPNVHTLYLQTVVMKGPHREDLAMVRVQETEKDKSLRQRFNQWRTETIEGQNSRLQNLEFVAVVPRESGPIEKRYLDVPDRLTSTPSDIVLENPAL